MTFTTIVYETLDGVGRITLSRPERANALSQEMLGEIARAVDLAEADPGVRALIVRGAGGAFSSGFDLKEQMTAPPSGTPAWEEILRRDFETVMRFWHASKPTIAAVRGPCLAGAFELALACDLTVASKDAFFGEPELKFGAGIVVMLLPWMVGPKIAREIILLGEDRLSASRAYEIGIVNRVVGTDELDRTALRIARHLGAMDPMLVRRTKRAINRSIEAQGLLGALEEGLIMDLVIEAEGSPDKRRFMEIARAEGLKAALAWRDGRFASEEP